jgi:hemerythrin-like domain-containing protein
VCEYCGCQSLAVIAELTDEHDRLRSLGRDLTDAGQTGDRSTAAALARHMLAVLRPHTAVEEDGLFPALAADFPQHMSDLYDDHKRIETALAQVAGGVRDDWAAVSVAAVTDLFDHILKEQDGVFPAALSTLTPGQWDRVAAARICAADATGDADSADNASRSTKPSLLPATRDTIAVTGTAPLTTESSRDRDRFDPGPG